MVAVAVAVVEKEAILAVGLVLATGWREVEVPEAEAEAEAGADQRSTKEETGAAGFHADSHQQDGQAAEHWQRLTKSGYAERSVSSYCPPMALTEDSTSSRPSGRHPASLPSCCSTY